MKHRIFFASDEMLIAYLQKYGQIDRAIDHEINMSLHAKEFWEKKLGQKLMVVFEQNDKMHKYPERFTAGVEELKEILQTYNEQNTPVDFALAPVSSPEKFDGFAYPFQVKRARLKVSGNVTKEFADFINEKANKYRAIDTCLILDPQLVGDNKDKKMFQVDELKSLLKIDEQALRAIYIFQSSSEATNFLPLWVSQKALAESI